MLTIFAISFISKIMYIYIECRFILHGIGIFKVSLRLESAVNIVYLLKKHVGGHSIDTRAYSFRFGILYVWSLTFRLIRTLNLTIS